MAGLNGPDKRLSLYRGRPLIINVWASWCGPCRAEMASLERLAWLEAKPPYPTAFRIIGISTDDDPDSARRLLQATNATLSHFIDDKLRLEHMLGASRLPLTVLVTAPRSGVGQVDATPLGVAQGGATVAHAALECMVKRQVVGLGHGG